jgi:hypothetical protein
MATWNDMPSGQIALLVKGAPDAVLALCRDRETATTTMPLDQENGSASSRRIASWPAKDSASSP